jgi:hypothetical protein
MTLLPEFFSRLAQMARKIRKGSDFCERRLIDQRGIPG